MEKQKNRIKFLDIARGIAIILMVCGHADGTGYVEKAVNLFNMSLFVFISGYLFNSEKIKNLKELFNYDFKRIKKLYIFYFVFEIVYLLLTNIFFKIGFYNSNVLYGGKKIYPIISLKALFLSILKIIFGMGREPFCGAFWFIISLIFIIVFYSLICFFSNRVSKNKSKIFKFLLVMIFFIIGCMMYYLNINIPRLSPALTMLIMFYFGELSKNSKEAIKYNSNNMFLISILILILLYPFGKISMNANAITNPIYYLLCSLSGIYCILFISKKIERLNYCSKIFSYIGSHTISIMGLHFLGFKIVQLLQLNLGIIKYSELALLRVEHQNVLWYLLSVLSGVLFPIICSKILTFTQYIKKRRIKNEN